MKFKNLLLLMFPLIQLGCAHPRQAAQMPMPSITNCVEIILHEFKAAGYAIPENVVDELVQVELK